MLNELIFKFLRIGDFGRVDVNIDFVQFVPRRECDVGLHFTDFRGELVALNGAD